MLCSLRRSDRTMPADVAVFQSSPNFDHTWRNMFEFQPTDFKVPTSRIQRQRSISNNRSMKLISQLEKATAGLLLKRSSTEPKVSKETKRSVSFADDHGQPLYTEKVINELPHEPPTLKSCSVDQLVQRLKLTIPLNKENENNTPKKAFSLDFKQPMSDYMVFKDKLQTNLVALENIIVRNRSILGTVKVRNVCFEKEVIVRFTFDGWKTFVDVPSKHITNAYEGDQQDTFKFSATIPGSYHPSQRVEFCVCFRAGEGVEYWDNNGGVNYSMTCVAPRLLSPDGNEDHPALLPEFIAPSPSSIFY